MDAALKRIMHKERGDGEERVGDEMPRGLKVEEDANQREIKILSSWRAKHFSHICLDTHKLTNETPFAIYRPAV